MLVTQWLEHKVLTPALERGLFPTFEEKAAFLAVRMSIHLIGIWRRFGSSSSEGSNVMA
jgi:hypothetical protein